MIKIPAKAAHISDLKIGVGDEKDIEKQTLPEMAAVCKGVASTKQGKGCLGTPKSHEKTKVLVKIASKILQGIAKRQCCCIKKSKLVECKLILKGLSLLNPISRKLMKQLLTFFNLIFTIVPPARTIAFGLRQNLAYAMVYLIFTCIRGTRLFVYKNNMGHTFAEGKDATTMQSEHLMLMISNLERRYGSKTKYYKSGEHGKLLPQRNRP